MKKVIKWIVIIGVIVSGILLYMMLDLDSKNVRPEVKEALDSYEDFFDEYIKFMNNYKNSSDPLSMMGELTVYMEKYQTTMSKMNALEGDLNDSEVRYYEKVVNRIKKKLSKVE